MKFVKKTQNKGLEDYELHDGDYIFTFTEIKEYGQFVMLWEDGHCICSVKGSKSVELLTAWNEFIRLN